MRSISQSQVKNTYFSRGYNQENPFARVKKCPNSCINEDLLPALTNFTTLSESTKSVH